GRQVCGFGWRRQVGDLRARSGRHVNDPKLARVVAIAVRAIVDHSQAATVGTKLNKTSLKDEAGAKHSERPLTAGRREPPRWAAIGRDHEDALLVSRQLQRQRREHGKVGVDFKCDSRTIGANCNLLNGLAGHRVDTGALSRKGKAKTAYSGHRANFRGLEDDGIAIAAADMQFLAFKESLRRVPACGQGIGKCADALRRRRGALATTSCEADEKSHHARTSPQFSWS